MLHDNELTSSNVEKPLGFLLDRKINSEAHISSLCKKAGHKINTIARLKTYLTSDQRDSLLNSIITSQFTFCSLACMFVSHVTCFLCLHNELRAQYTI